jgi:hypothetical protein
MSANLAAAKGIEPCPMCGSDQVRWRKRRPTDFVLTWGRWCVELIASMFASGQLRQQHREHHSLQNDLNSTIYEDFARTRDTAREQREANTGHRTPKRFWRCKACNREGHVF